jgi:centromere protein V
MTSYLHLIIPVAAFRLMRGIPSTYTFNSHIAQHHFCPDCGIKSYYIPRSNPDGVSVNFRCVDQSTFDLVDYRNFDGQNWEANAGSLIHLSRRQE